MMAVEEGLQEDMYLRIGLSCPAGTYRRVIGPEVESAPLPLVGLRAVVTMALTIHLIDQMKLDLLPFAGELSMPKRFPEFGRQYSNLTSRVEMGHFIPADV